MHLKDYYKILELEPSASFTEIKQAYRRLAQIHHPDKNNNDPSSASIFADIREAYEVLTNPSKKEQYLQQRWYQQSTGIRKTEAIINPVSVLKEMLELDRYVSKLDVHRMDKEGLSEYIIARFDDSTIGKLKAFNDQDTNDQVIYLVLKCMKVLKAGQASGIAKRLSLFASQKSQVMIDEAIREQQRKEKWENNELLIALLVTIAICLLIWFSL